jgi:hypothetical protein
MGNFNMKMLYENRSSEDLDLLGKICFDTLNLNISPKYNSEKFVGIYFEGRNRELSTIEDCAAYHSFRVFSEYNYPYIIFSPNSNNLLNNRYKDPNIIHIKIPVCDTHDKYSRFMIENIWNYVPKYVENMLFCHPDGFLIKRGWEEFVLRNDLGFVGSAWCHAPGIDILENNTWRKLDFPNIQCGNGGFSFRKRSLCEKVSNKYSKLILRETGREDCRYPPEDLFYSHLINGEKIGIVAFLTQCMKFSLDPITLEEYNKKISFGFHYPKRFNDFQKHRDYYLSL